MKKLLLLFLLAMPLAAQDLRPSAYVGKPGVITVRGGKVLGSTGGVVTISGVDITPANSATTYIYLDISGTPVVSSNTTGFPASNYFPICIVIKDANGVITSFTDSRPDYFFAGGAPPSGFNVKTLGGKGDTRSCNVANSAGGGSTHITGACSFAATDVGKKVVLNAGDGSFTTFAVLPTITVFNSSSDVTLDTANNGGAVSNGIMIYGTVDDTAFSAAATAAIACSQGLASGGNKNAITCSPTLYLPAGGYLLCTVLANGAVTLNSPSSGFTMLGDGPDMTFIYAGSTPACTFNGANGAIINEPSGANNVVLRGFTIDGGNNVPSTAPAMLLGGQTHLYDVIVQRWGLGNTGVSGISSQGGTVWGNRVTLVNNGRGMACAGCQGEFYESITSNNGGGSATAVNLLISGTTGLNTGTGFRWVNGLIDECGSNPNGCTQIVKSSDVWFIGGGFFSTNSGQAISVDANSFLHMNGGIAGVFGADSNAGGITIANGGTVQATDVRFVSTGTGKCITNNGIFNDDGGNSCENMFAIASGTSTGTSATLTLTPVGANVNTNCTTGDSVLVQGANIAGYNGYFKAAITGATATTLTYTTVGSNLGALSAGGTAFCRNLQSYSGNLPVALLNNPVPNTCYVTGTFGATVTGAPMCNFKAQSATNISRITAASTTVTACTVAPVVTISDGTASVTLTITTAKSQWDSAVDASSGVGTTIFKPNGTIQVTNTAGTCTTAPTNFSVSYNISPILSN